MSGFAHEVRLEADEIHFPDCCAGCDGGAEVTYDLRAERGVDLVGFSLAQWLDLPLPLCRACRHRRRVAGIVGALLLFAALAAIVVVPIVVTGDDVSTEAAVVMAVAVFGLVILYRWRARPITDWRLLGLRARLVKFDSSLVELRFGRPEYYVRWLDLNRGRTATQPAPR